MVKKISGKAGKIQSSRSIETVGVGDTKQVDKASSKKTERADSTDGFALGAANREKILQMIEEEAESLFASDSKQKNISKNAVRMAIDSAIVKEPEEE